MSYDRKSPKDGGDFQRVLERLEQGLRVSLISSTNLVCCAAEEDTRTVAQTARAHHFDQIPVQDDGRIIGVWCDREDVPLSPGPVREAAEPLSESKLISAETGILAYVRAAASSPYHLVVEGNGIAGIVTRSDLLKLPVRIAIFTHVSALESVMADTIRDEFTEDQWVGCLAAGRQEKLDVQYGALSKRRLDTDRLLCTQFCDKRDIIAKVRLPSRLGQTERCFVRAMREVEELRDEVMHANKYLDDAAELTRLVDLVGFWLAIFNEHRDS